MPDTPLKALLTRLVVRYHTQEALAKAIGLTGSRLNRVLKGQAGEFGVPNCLRLAKVAELPASQVLRMCGKADVATLIEELYGTPAKPIAVPTINDMLLAVDDEEREIATEFLRRFLAGGPTVKQETQKRVRTRNAQRSR